MIKMLPEFFLLNSEPFVEDFLELESEVKTQLLDQLMSVDDSVVDVALSKIAENPCVSC